MWPLIHTYIVCREERAKCLNQGSDLGSVPTPTKPSLEHSTSVCEIMEATLAEVTQQDKLDILTTLYSQCLDGKTATIC